MLRRSVFILATSFYIPVFLATGWANSAATATPDNIRLTWSESPKTTQTIGWRTDASVSVGKVQYSALGQPIMTAAAPAPETLVTNIGPINLFSVTLRGLQPGTKYRYRVGDGTRWSATIHSRLKKPS